MDAPAVPFEQMAVEEPSSPDRYVFHAELPTLEHMASCSVALSIWRNYISSHSKPNSNVDKIYYFDPINTLGLPDAYTYKKVCYQMVESLKTPKSIENTLKSNVTYVYNNTKNCILHFDYSNYDHSEGEKALCWIERFDINWCVWLPNGDIDLPKTASKILDLAELTPEQRFAILCQFCMNEEIEKFPLDSLSELFISKLDFNRDYVMFYWIRYLKNELHEIPLGNFNSLDALMAQTCGSGYFTAFLYFWSRLGDDDQLSVVESKLSNIHSEFDRYQDIIFSKMSWQQQQRLLSLIPDRILLNFWISLNVPETAMWAWAHIKSIITPTQFTKIIRKLFRASVPFKDDRLRHIFEIWHSADDEQRSHAILELGDAPIKALCRLKYRNEAALNFARMYLMARCEDFRKQAILRNADKLASRLEDPNWIDSIVQLCLPQAVDQLEYKRLVMRSERLIKRAKLLIFLDRCERLIFIMKYYFSDEEMLREFMTRLMESENEKSLLYLTDVEKWNKLCQFIDQVFPRDVAFALNLKKIFITSYAQTCDHYWNAGGRLYQMDKIIRTVFTHDEELQLVKNSFLNSFRTELSRASFWKWFEENYFNRFLSWCLNGDEKAMAEFIRNMPVSEIFDAFFNEIEEWYKNSQIFITWRLGQFNNCLRYIKGVEGARQYKIEKIKDFEKNRLFPGIFQRGSELCLDMIFNWAFDDNEEDVRKYKNERVVFMKD